MAYGPLSRSVAPATGANVASLITDRHVRIDATSGAQNYTLLPAAQTNGKYFTIIKIDASVNAIGFAGATVNGTVLTKVVQWGSLTVVSNGVSYDVVAVA